MVKTKADFAYEALKKQILTGEWSPNQRLVLNVLTKKLNLSMIPIREALKRLEKEGFVIQTPHQGYSVASMSEDELAELMMLREVLTLQALPMVLENITDSELEDLYKLTDEMKIVQDSLEADDSDEQLEKFRYLNKLFHRNIVTASGLVHLPDMLDNLMDLSNRYLNLVESSLGIREVDIKEHVAILDAIETKDLKIVKKLVKHHQQRVMKEFASQIKKNRRLINGIFRIA